MISASSPPIEVKSICQRSSYSRCLTSLKPKTKFGEHIHLGCCWTRLASRPFAFQLGRRPRNLLVRPWFFARARKTAREGACAPHSTSVFRVESGFSLSPARNEWEERAGERG